MLTTSDLTIHSSELSLEVVNKIYAVHGAIIVKDLIQQKDVGRFQKALYDVIVRGLLKNGLKPTEAFPNDLDQVYKQLQDSDPECAARMKSIAKDLLIYHEFLRLPEITGLVRYFFGHDGFMINYDNCLFRIDRPDEIAYEFEWHQDYPHNVLSTNALTIWSPLTRITEDMGYLRIIPGSHHDFLPVEIYDNAPRVKYQGHRNLRLQQADAMRVIWDEQATIIDTVEPGDVLILSAFLMHRSGGNRGDKCRWVYNPRHGDLYDSAVVGRNWRTARPVDPYVISDIHPDKVRRIEWLG